MADKNTDKQSTQENLSEVEAAQWLKVSRITLQRARLRGELDYYRVGGSRVIYSMQHLKDYLKKRERKAYGLAESE